MDETDLSSLDPAWAAPPDLFLGNGHELGFPIIGDGVDDAQYWQLQTTDFTCAVVSQQMILKQFGIDVSEAQLVYDATTNGWLTEGGTSPADLGRLLEYYGVSTHMSVGGGVDAVVDELAHGRKVVIALDSGEMWQQDPFFEDWINPNGADHAVVLTGLDLADPGNPKVVINDPGDPQGAGRSYPLDQFLDAWADSGQLYVATDQAPPELSLHPILGNQFDAGQGMYMDESFWLHWKEALRDRGGAVLDRFTETGTFGEATAAAVVRATIDAWERMDDAARNELFISV